MTPYESSENHNWNNSITASTPTEQKTLNELPSNTDPYTSDTITVHL